MNSFREMKDIGNVYMPVRMYSITIEKSNRMEIDIISGFGIQPEKEVCISSCPLPHWHTYFEVVYIMEGKASIQVNSYYFEATPGDVVLIDSKDIHNISGQCKYKVINIEPSHIFHIKSTHEDIFPKSLEGKWIRENEVGDETRKKIIENIHELFQLYHQKSQGYSLHIMGKIFLLLGDIQNHTHNVSRGETRGLVGNRELARMNKILDYIKDNYSQPISIQDAAKAVNLAPNYFCRFFKKNMGKTFMEYLNHYRCIQADMLLYHSDKTVTEISLETGFSSLSYFDKVYKKSKGNSPKIERRAYRKKS